MAHGPLTFRKRDLRAAIETIEQTGRKVGRVRIDTKQGIFDVVLAGEDVVQSGAGELNEWDEVLR